MKRKKLKKILTLCLTALVFAGAFSAYGISSRAMTMESVAVIPGSESNTETEKNGRADPLRSALHRSVENASLKMDAVLGYDGTVTYSKWIPVFVRIENNGKDIVGKIAVNAYRNELYYDRYEIPVSVPAGSIQELVLPVRAFRKQEVFTVEFVQDEKTICAVNVKPEKSVSPASMLVGLFSASPQSLKYLDITAETDSLKRGEYWQTINLSRENFPQTKELMESFGLLVIDGQDAGMLSEKQQKVLLDWIKEGGIVLVSGGAAAKAGYAWFEEHTGLRAGDVSEVTALTKALTDYAGLQGGGSERMLFNAMEGVADPLILHEGKPAAALFELGRGSVYFMGFELATKSFTQWEGAHSIFQHILLRSNPEMYQEALLAGTEENDHYDNFTSIAHNTPVRNEGSLYGIFALIGGCILLSGFGAYLILKKVDKREWLWLVIPASALFSGVLIFMFSLSGKLNTPIAAETILWSIDEDGEMKINLCAVVACPEPKETTISLENGMKFQLTSDSGYYYSGEGDGDPFPTEKLFQYSVGEDFAIRTTPDSSYSSLGLMGKLQELPEGRVQGSFWMEEDGLHLEIQNETPYVLERAVILSSQGFLRLGSIAPGESREGMLKREDTLDEEALKSDSLYRDGYMSTVSDIHQVSYSYFDAMREEEGIDNNQLRTAFYTLIDRWYRDNNSYNTNFHLVAFVDDFLYIPLEVNGESVTRYGASGIIDLELKLEAMGRTGIVYCPAGSVPVYAAELDEAGYPVMDTSTRLKGYWSGQDSRICGFVIPTDEECLLTSIQISAQVYGNNVTGALYNFRTGVWDTQNISLYMELDEISIRDHVNEDGELYLRFASSGQGKENYLEFETPVLVAEGRKR